MRGYLFILVIFLLSAPSGALTTTKSSCQIIIVLEKKNGEQQNIQFQSALKSKEHCKTLAQFHRKNFDPHAFRSKKVTFVWKQSKKTIPILAEAKKPNRKIKRKRGKQF